MLVGLLSEIVVRSRIGISPTVEIDMTPARFMAATGLLFVLKGTKSETMTIGEEKVGGTDAD